jgi:hypothetical protein
LVVGFADGVEGSVARAGPSVAFVLRLDRSGASPGASADAAALGRSSGGTCCRLTRTRVHVDERPRIASTRTSAGCRYAAT